MAASFAATQHPDATRDGPTSISLTHHGLAGRFARRDVSYQVSGLDPAHFRHLYGLSDDALAAFGAERCFAGAKPGFPDRIELRDAELGESLLLINYEHQPAHTPYRLLLLPKWLTGPLWLSER